MEITLDYNDNSGGYITYNISPRSHIAEQGFVEIEFVGVGVHSLKFRVSLEQLQVLIRLSEGIYEGLVEASVVHDQLRRGIYDEDIA